jgi:hypothetical protein
VTAACQSYPWLVVRDRIETLDLPLFSWPSSPVSRRAWLRLKDRPPPATHLASYEYSYPYGQGRE